MGFFPRTKHVAEESDWKVVLTPALTAKIRKLLVKNISLG